MGDEVAVVQWERFMPRMALRVLLVESDESTRQLITALLKKCGYRVAAVGDGLKAWEFLKKKPQNIDLILTEVDLPSISGYALLTLIMEHGSCRNTPVIMMSSQDSVSTVYKCMLKGAVDFLVKPVRINELRNLWQHVWRRQALGKNGPQDESLILQEEATDENNNVSTPSSGFVVCVQTNKKCIEIGSDAQSSCTKSDTEVEMVHEDHHPEINTNIWKEEECVKSSLRKHYSKKNGLEVDHGEATIKDTVAAECNKDNAFVKTSGEAIDFIGSFNDHFDGNSRNSGVTNNTKFDSSPMLDLSLWRSHPRGPLNQVSEDRQALNHSDVSAFSRYVNKVPQPLHSPTSICNQQRDFGTNSEKHFSEQTFNYNSYTYSSSPSSQNNLLSSANGHASPSLQQKVISIPVPRSFQQVYKSMDQNFDTSAKQADNNIGCKLDSPNYKMHNSSATDQSASGSLCNVNAVHRNSMGCGNNGCIDKTSVGGSVVESGNEDSSVFDMNYQRNVQREAALTKFRLKRKERCFEKKVRYESRKKLAEKRPRVKGQFVRQSPALVEIDS